MPMDLLQLDGRSYLLIVCAALLVENPSLTTDRNTPSQHSLLLPSSGRLNIKKSDNFHRALLGLRATYVNNNILFPLSTLLNQSSKQPSELATVICKRKEPTTYDTRAGNGRTLRAGNTARFSSRSMDSSPNDSSPTRSTMTRYRILFPPQRPSNRIAFSGIYIRYMARTTRGLQSSIQSVPFTFSTTRHTSVNNLTISINQLIITIMDS